MSDVKVPYPEAGQAAFEQLDTYSADLLISGSWPAMAPGYPMVVKASQALKQFEVVGKDADGNLVPATWNATPANAIQPIGICSQAVTGNADGTTTVDVILAGCFNPDVLVWDATFDTDAKKQGAFFGAPSPTEILIRARG